MSWYHRRVPGVSFDVAARARIAAAVTAAEQGHRGEIVVHVEGVCLRDPLRRAARLFVRGGYGRTRDDTAVLLYVATRSRKVAVWAGRGVVGAAAIESWRPTMDAVIAGMKAGRPIDGVVDGVTAIGLALRERAAGKDRHGNELADGVAP